MSEDGRRADTVLGPNRITPHNAGGAGRIARPFCFPPPQARPPTDERHAIEGCALDADPGGEGMSPARRFSETSGGPNRITPHQLTGRIDSSIRPVVRPESFSVHYRPVLDLARVRA